MIQVSKEFSPSGMLPFCNSGDFQLAKLGIFILQFWGFLAYKKQLNTKSRLLLNSGGSLYLCLLRWLSAPRRWL